MDAFAKFIRAVFITVFILVIAIAIIIFLWWFFLARPYQTEVLETKYDKKGRLIMQRERGGAFREGWFDRTLLYDSLGNLVGEFGYETNTKYKKIYVYNDKKQLSKLTYYNWDSDIVKDTTNSFKEADSLLRSQEIYQFFDNQAPKESLKIWYLEYPNDTSSFDLIKYNAWGKIIERKEIDFQWENIVFDSLEVEKIISYDRYRIAYDSMLNKKDTLIKRIKK
jgi:hypothetical protein